jgi:hypothetical protein
MRRREDVLRYTREKVPQRTVFAHYISWRKDERIPDRCDKPTCMFHTQPLMWNGKPLKPILDHANGNNSDNRVENLRFLCPNCDSQLATRGGANKGRVEKSEGGFALLSKDGRRDYTLTAERGVFTSEGSAARFVVTTGSSSRTRPRRR